MSEKEWRLDIVYNADSKWLTNFFKGQLVIVLHLRLFVQLSGTTCMFITLALVSILFYSIIAVPVTAIQLHTVVKCRSQLLMCVCVSQIPRAVIHAWDRLEPFQSRHSMSNSRAILSLQKHCLVLHLQYSNGFGRREH